MECTYNCCYQSFFSFLSDLLLKKDGTKKKTKDFELAFYLARLLGKLLHESDIPPDRDVESFCNVLYRRDRWHKKIPEEPNTSESKEEGERRRTDTEAKRLKRCREGS